MKRIYAIIFLFTGLQSLAQQKDSLPKVDTAVFNKTKLLDAVAVKSKKPFVEMQADKIILNVQNDAVASSGTVFEVLQRAPGVSVSNDETINLSGKQGVNILIDGKPAQLSGKDLADYLKSLPATVVDKVEIIRNPSAKYDAQGNAGIINIRMKKNTAKGVNGSVSSSYSQSVHGNINASGLINWRKNKWNVFTNVAARKWRQNTSGAINRFVNSNSVNKTFENSTTDEDASKNLNFSTGADFYLNQKNTFGILVKGTEYKSNLYTPGVTLIKSTTIIDSSLSTINDNNQRKHVYNYNLNYKYADTAGTELNIDADHTSFRDNSSGLVTTKLYNKTNQQYGYTANDQDVNTTIKIYSLKADVVKPFKKQQAKIETGLKWNTIITNNDLQAFLWNTNFFKADTGRTNQFNYTETMYAAYASFTQQKGKWEYQLGLRGEQSVIKGTSTDLKNRVIRYPDTSYFNIFPTAFLRYTANAKNSFGLTAGRRINRPTYQDLNPFEYIYDNYTKERGNPYLLPELSNNIELNYVYGSLINVAVGYSQTVNSFQSISTQKGEVTEATNYNIGKDYRLYCNLGLNIPFTKWWSSYSNLSPFYKEYKGAVPAGKLDNTTLGMSWYSSHNFSLPKKWKAQLSSWGNVATLDGMYKTSWLGSIDAACSKLILKDKINIRLAVIDIFNTQRWQQAVAFGNVNFNYSRKWESRNVRLQLTWKIGKTNYQKRDRETGAEDANSRIK